MRRIVVKLGTNVIMRADGKVALGLLCGLVEQIAAIRDAGTEVLLVSSGAVGLGVERLGLTSRPEEVAQVQACAAVGQSRLMALYEDAFDRLGCRIAQVLLTEDDFRDPLRHANLGATLHALLSLGVIPIANENDTVSIAELERPAGSSQQERLFGDNDKLSALLSRHINADLLLLLSDVDGLYDGDPSSDSAALIPPRCDGGRCGVGACSRGEWARARGDVLQARVGAHIAVEAGMSVVIANGRTPDVLTRILAGEQVGTRFGAKP